MRERRIFPFLWISALFLAQNFLTHLFGGASPSLVLIAVIFFSMRHGARPGLIFGLYAGMLAEIYGQGSFGFYMTCWAAVGVIAGFISTQVFQDSLPAEIFLPGLATYLLNFAELIYRQTLEGGAFPWHAFVRAFQPGTLVGTILASLLLFSWLAKTPAHRRRGAVHR